MKKTFIFLFLLLATLSISAAESLKYTIIKNPYRFTTYYEMIGEENYIGRVVDNFFHARTTFDLYDAKGDYEGQGVCRALSVGVIFPWAREIDVYDSLGKKIGFIDGKTLTTASAKFNLYGEDNKLMGVAYYDYDGSGFSIVDGTKNEKALGYFKRDLAKKDSKDWHALIYDINRVDARVLKIFSAFVVKKQKSF